MLIRPSVSSTGWPPLLPRTHRDLPMLNPSYRQQQQVTTLSLKISALYKGFFIPTPVHPSMPTQSHALLLGCSAQAREEIRPLDTLVGQRRSRLPVNCGTSSSQTAHSLRLSLIDPPRSSTPARAMWTRRVCTRYDELGGGKISSKLLVLTPLCSAQLSQMTLLNHGKLSKGYCGPWDYLPVIDLAVLNHRAHPHP